MEEHEGATFIAETPNDFKKVIVINKEDGSVYEKINRVSELWEITGDNLFIVTQYNGRRDIFEDKWFNSTKYSFIIK